MKISEVVAANIKSFMTATKMNQVQLHVKTGISKNTISTILKGTNKQIRFEVIERIAEALKIEVSELFKDRWKLDTKCGTTRKDALSEGLILANEWYGDSYDIIKDEQMAQKKTESSAKETVAATRNKIYTNITRK